MDSAGDAVLKLQVHLGDSVLGEDRGIGDITCITRSAHCSFQSQFRLWYAEYWWRRTDGSRLDHVTDGESLDCLVLRGASRAVGAADGLDVAAALLVATAMNC